MFGSKNVNAAVLQTVRDVMGAVYPNVASAVEADENEAGPIRVETIDLLRAMGADSAFRVDA